MKVLFVPALLIVSAISAMPAFAEASFACRNAWGEQRADVDGPVLSVKDLGPTAGDKGRYRIVIRDTFTGCRVLDQTITACKVGQHASSVGGTFSPWIADDPGSDADYSYIGGHIWDCE